MDPHVRVLFTKFKLLKRYIFSTRINLDNIHKNSSRHLGGHTMLIIRKQDDTFFIQKDHGKPRQLNQEEIAIAHEKITELSNKKFSAIYFDELDFIEA